MRKVNMHIEGVPNPNAMKFVLENGMLTENEFEFQKFSETGVSPLARKIMMLRYVERVLIYRNYITVLKNPTAEIEWQEVLPEVRQMIVSHLENNEPIIYIGAKEVVHNKSEDVLVELILQLLNEHIRPAAQEDGGDIMFESFEKGIVHVRTVGACFGCVYANQTIKEGVEPLLTGMIPEVKEVRWV
jgi:Fe-S cluster biogenesis protein NfuA